MAGLARVLTLVLSALPILAVFSPAALAPPWSALSVLADPRLLSAVKLSLATSVASATLAVLAALPVSYYVARRGGLLARVSSSAFLLLLGFPPVGVGVSLLILLREYPVVSLLADHLGLLFSRKAVVLAQLAVAVPIAVGVLTNVLSYLPPYVDELARVYGIPASLRFRRLVLPLAMPGVLGAWALVWFRCFGEFGATLVLAGNTPNYTETVPMAVYNMLSLVEVERAAALLTLSAMIGLAAVVAYSVASSRMVARVRRLVGEVRV